MRWCPQHALFYGGDLQHAAELVRSGRARKEHFSFFRGRVDWRPGELRGEVELGEWSVASPVDGDGVVPDGPDGVDADGDDGACQRSGPPALASWQHTHKPICDVDACRPLDCACERRDALLVAQARAAEPQAAREALAWLDICVMFLAYKRIKYRFNDSNPSFTVYTLLSPSCPIKAQHVVRATYYGLERTLTRPSKGHIAAGAAASQTPGGASRCMPWGTGTAETVMVSPPGRPSLGVHCK